MDKKPLYVVPSVSTPVPDLYALDMAGYAQDMLQALKLKSLDLEPIYASWKDGPKFLGNPTTTGSVDEWLRKIKLGCVEREVPKEYWHKVGQHFMGDKARKRLDELKVVMKKVHGGFYRWNWKKFKVAMRNMSCE